jgi:hypothetical protein
VVQAEAVTWPDGALGCPEPGIVYTQALVPGYWVVVEAEETPARLPGWPAGFVLRVRRRHRRRPARCGFGQCPGYGSTLMITVSVSSVAPPRFPAPRSPLVNTITPSSGELPGKSPKS